MLPRHHAPDREKQLEHERRLQVSGALLLGFAVLVVVVLRARAHHLLLPGWWHHL